MIQSTTDTIWVGMDVHQASITAAILHGDDVEPQVVRLPGDLNAARRLFRRLAAKGVPRACYEASGAGYVLQRTLSDDGFHCEVIAPSLIPSKPGDHRKTDRLDAIHLVQQFRSGHLTAVSVPDVDQEAVRHLVRAPVQPQAGHPVQEPDHGHPAGCRLPLHRDRDRMDQGALCLAGQAAARVDRTDADGAASELQLLEYLEASLSSLEAAITEVSVQRPWREPVEALCCFRGVKTLTAMTIVSEIGDIKRFGSPRQLMSYVGLVPSERSSGERSHRGPITKAGNRYLRRVLIESSQHCRTRTASTLRLQRRRAGQDPVFVGIALKAQHRLQRRYAHLARTKHTNKAITAVAREFCGFLWAMLWEVEGRR